eukprot:TRINITY_DN102297_c0_g1_i1.p1 TRINITY_DN102297_c0_g1~~TRINITY_DN102297_c0_g1_i1.p1  ORF type:complete len:617 (+),score=102.82 TRINITY_DN102297_c0_g1_i1:132-1982(+)
MRLSQRLHQPRSSRCSRPRSVVALFPAAAALILSLLPGTLALRITDDQHEEDASGLKISPADAAALKSLVATLRGKHPEELAVVSGDPRHKKKERWTSYDKNFRFSVSEYEAESARTAIFRISTKVRKMDGGGAPSWLFNPSMPECSSHGSSVGTGWIVHQKPLILCTNAHVVLDALNVLLQFPILGKRYYKGVVRMISQDFDLAFVMFQDEAEFLSVAHKAGIALRTLPLADISCPLGADVMAVGFPLAGNLAKVTKGVISGTKTVRGLPLGSANNVCSGTAPISPGNSGGPLLFLDSNLSVAGVNFASDTKGQNNNYVVPGFRVRQLLSKLDLKNPGSAGWPVVWPGGRKGAGDWHVQVRLPRSDLVASAGYPALKSVIGKCPLDKVFVSSVPETSVFSGAVPPLPRRFMLLSIDGLAVDKHGQSRNPEYFSDPLAYGQLIFLRQDLTGNASVRVCASGKTTVHTVPLRWKDDFNPKVPNIVEPSHHHFDFEQFAGVTVMELTMLHVDELIKNKGLKTMERFKLPSFQTAKHLFVSSVAGDAAQALEVGMIVDKVNGVAVHSLNDYRKAILRTARRHDAVVIETDQGVIYAGNVTAELSKRAAVAKQQARVSAR